MKVGELAKRTGISVRALHHYDEIGLLSPSQHSDSGHRIYTQSDVARLQQIVSLKALGLSLTQIAESLRDGNCSLVSTIELHLERLKTELVERQKLANRLEKIEQALKSKEQPTLDELVQLIEAINMFEKYYSQEDLAKLAERGTAIGDDRIRQYEAEWAELIESVKSAMEKGIAPHEDQPQRYAKQWQDLIAAFTGGDKNIAGSLGRMYREEGAEKASRGALDEKVCRYMGEAIQYLKCQST